MDSCVRIMRPLCSLLAILIIHHSIAHAQHLAGGRKKTDSVPVFRHEPPTDSMIENRLVALALEGPRYSASNHQVKVSAANLQKAKRSWMNLLSVSVNYNDQSFAKPSTLNQTGYVYPKYFFGLTIPIGLFFTMGPDIKAAKETMEINKSNQESLARNLRTEVLGKWKQYRNYGELILLQNTIVVDQQTVLATAEKKFKDGGSFDDYNKQNHSYSDEKAKMLNLQLQQDLIRLDIEALIGTSLDSVIR